MNKLDHIVIAAQDLAQGAEYLRATLGVDVAPGGKHQSMATHNLLMQLGNDCYLEVIAIDPEGETPRHPRWFALDTAQMRAESDLVEWQAALRELLQRA